MWMRSMEIRRKWDVASVIFSRDFLRRILVCST
jgi:hypothetical protein